MTNFNKSSMTENRKKSVCKSKRQRDYPHPLSAVLMLSVKFSNFDSPLEQVCHFRTCEGISAFSDVFSAFGNSPKASKSGAIT